jgi:pilus assembly protein CpaF
MVTKKEVTNPLKTIMGPLWKLYSDETVWEILIDAFDDVYYVSNSGMKSESFFKSREALDQFVDRLLKHSKKKISKDEMSYFFQIDKNTRVNIVLPPLAIKGPNVVITKFPKQDISLDDLISWKALDLEGKVLIEKILNSNKGFLVAGNMGSGKTTLLNVLVNAIPEPYRVITLERMADLVLTRPKTCRLQSQTQKAKEMIELIAVAEKMRGDYIVLSECVGPEVGPFLEMIRSNCTGVALTTGENVLDAVKRLVTKTVLSSDGFTLEEANYVLAQSFPYIIFQEKREDGKRIISSITETSYLDGELKLKVLYKR